MSEIDDGVPAVIRLPTFSGVQHAAACPASVTLPSVQDESEAGDLGTAKHALLADANERGWDQAIADAPAHIAEWAAKIDRAELPEVGAGTHRSERAWVVSCGGGGDITARSLGAGLARRYPELSTWELAGTTDLDGPGDVGDFKTGARRVTRCIDNWQMRLGALAVRHATGATMVTASVIYIDEDGQVDRDMATWDEFDLDDLGAELVWLMDRWHAQAERPQYVRGRHCRDCHGFDFCPATTALLWDAANEAQLAHVAISQGALAQAVKTWRDLETLTKTLGARIGAAASYRPIDLGDGRFYGMAPGREQVADAELVSKLLTELTNVEVARAAVQTVTTTEEHTTLGDIRKAMTAAKMRPEQRSKVFERLRAAGALQRATTLREYTAGKVGGEED